jgi:putative membrane protein
MMWNGWNSWSFMPMTALMLVVLGLLIAGVVVLARFAGRPPERTSPDPAAEPERLLALRFARGEIDEQEYRSRLAALRDHDSAAR